MYRKECNELSQYSDYVDSISDNERDEFILNVRKLYIDENLTLNEVALKLNVSKQIIVGAVRSNNFRKSKELRAESSSRRSKESMKEKYGEDVRSVFQLDFVKTKIKETNIKKYGTGCPLQNKEIKSKSDRTNLERYGTIYPSQNEDIKKKTQETNIIKYGNKCSLHGKEVKKKVIKTFNRKYGVDCSFKSNIVKRKIKETNLKRYGVENPLQNESIKDKVKNTNLDRYGVEYYFQTEEIKSIASQNRKDLVPDHVKEIIYNRDKFLEFLLEFDYKDRTWYNISKRLNYWTTNIGHQYRILGLDKDCPINVKHYRSHYEDEIIEYIKQVCTDKEINTNVRTKYEIDIYIPEFNFGIEFNGDYWHSELNKDSMYHQNKSLFFSNNGIFIYHIWEYEWLDIIKQEIIKSQIRNLLHKNERIIYARKCEIKKISPSVCREFLDKNHIQGNINSEYKLGLFHNEELVSVMTFGKSRFSKSEDIELHRFCNKLNTSVVGGASKLFKYFIRNYSDKFESIVSYCNISKGSGKLYKNLGFKLEKVTSPNYVWINIHSKEVRSRYQTQMKNEREIMESEGFVKLFDCGNYKFVYNILN